jgi:hypothetical protein
MHDWGETLAPMEASFPAPQDLKKGEDTQLRWAIRSAKGTNASAFIFVNNYERFYKLSVKKNVQLEACGVKLPKLTIPSGCMAIFPVNIDGIRYATAQLVAHREGKIYMMQVSGIPTIICMANGKTLKNIKPCGTENPVYENIYLITKAEAERLFLSEEKEATSITMTAEKMNEAGSLRTIIKGRAKVAEAPSEQDWEQAAVYKIQIPALDKTRVGASLLSISYRGDCARLYANGRLIADNFYYGRPFFYGLWRLSEDCSQLELRILPLQPDAPIYLPREADKNAGEQVYSVEIIQKKDI